MEGRWQIIRGKVLGKWREGGGYTEGTWQVGIEEGKDKAAELHV